MWSTKVGKKFARVQIGNQAKISNEVAMEPNIGMIVGLLLGNSEHASGFVPLTCDDHTWLITLLWLHTPFESILIIRTMCKCALKQIFLQIMSYI